MASDFLTTFEKIKLDAESRQFFHDVTVEYMKTNSSGELVQICIRSSHLIPKTVIYNAEAEIIRAYFGTGQTNVTISEHFELSGLYTPKTLWDVYKESIYTELRSHSSLSYSILKNATVEFPSDDEMTIKLTDSLIARKREWELKGFLSTIFEDRCNLKVKCNCVFEEQEEDFRTEKEHKINLMVADISRRVYTVKDDSKDDEIATYGIENKADTKASADKPSEKVEKPKEEKKSFEKKSFERKGKFSSWKNAKDENGNVRSIRRSDNPDILYGKEFLGDPTPISEIVDEIGEVVIRGKIISMEDRALRNEKHLFTFSVTDFTDSIICKIFVYEEQKAEFESSVKVGEFVKLKGIAAYDSFSKEISIGSISGIAKIGNFTTKRKDLSLKKRVELHCHTKFSDMDGISYAKDIIKEPIPGAGIQLPSPITV